MLTIEKTIIYLSAFYLLIRGGMELYKILKRKYLEDYLPLKRARKYKNDTEVYLYHLFNYAQSLLNREKYQKSHKYLEKVLAQRSDYPQANYLMGIIAFTQDNYQKASEHLRKEAVISPDHPMVHYFLAKAYHQLGEYEKALESVTISRDQNPYYYSVYLQALEIFAHLNREPETEWNYFKKAEEVQSLVKPVWLHMQLLEENFLSEAEKKERDQFYQSLDEHWIKSTKLKQRILQSIAQKKNYQAEALALQGLQRNPHDNQLYQLYDQVLLQQRKFDQALEFYAENYQRININPIQAKIRLSDYMIFNKKYQQALEVLLGLFEKYPNARFLHYPICLIYNWLGQPDVAIEHLRQAIYFDEKIKQLAQQNPELSNLQQRQDFQNIVS